MNAVRYKKALLSFVDVLGFKSLIEKETPQRIIEILTAKGRFDLDRLYRNKGYPPGTATTFNFSDLIVNVIPIEGVYFLDYLECLAYEDSTTGDLRYFLADQKKAILSAHEKYQHYKYKFVAEYHDEKCRSGGFNSSDYIIGDLT